MALATSITGAGTLLSVQREKGTYNYTQTSTHTDPETGEEEERTYKTTVWYTETRSEREWKAVTLSACETYAFMNPDVNVRYTLDNEVTQAYTLSRSIVERKITGMVTERVTGGE